MIVDNETDQERKKQRIDRFELDEIVGEGAFAIVWSAFDPKHDRTVAIKVLRLELRDSDAVERFEQEARAAGRLDHPHIVKTYDSGAVKENGTPKHFIVNQLVDGGMTLANWPVSADLGFRRSAEICRDIAHALEHAHYRDVLHRDLKPENVLMDKSGKPYVTDFGLALVEQERRTSANVAPGTLAYIAPEQAIGAPTEQSDIYSLGVVLYELLTGRLPFLGNNVLEVLDKKRSGAFKMPRDLDQSIPADLQTICLTCLRTDLDERYLTAGQLRDDLVRFLENRPVIAGHPTWSKRVAKWAQRHSMALLIALFVVSLMGIALTVAWLLTEQARSEAVDSRRHTQTNLRDSVNVVQSMLFQAAGEADNEEPSVAELLKTQATLAERLYQSYAANAGTDRLTRYQAAVGFQNLARIYQATGNESAEVDCWTNAIDIFDGLAAEYSSDSSYWLELGQTQAIFADRLGRLGRADQSRTQAHRAAANFEKCLQHSPSAHALCIIAGYLAEWPVVELRDTKRAVEISWRATAMEPKNARTWQILGIAQLRGGEFAEAIRVLKKAETLYKSNDRLSRVRGWIDVYLSIAHLKSHQTEEGIEYLNSATEWSKNQGQFAEGLAELIDEATGLIE